MPHIPVNSDPELLKDTPPALLYLIGAGVTLWLVMMWRWFRSASGKDRRRFMAGERELKPQFGPFASGRGCPDDNGCDPHAVSLQPSWNQQREGGRLKPARGGRENLRPARSGDSTTGRRSPGLSRGAWHAALRVSAGFSAASPAITGPWPRADSRTALIFCPIGADRALRPLALAAATPRPPPWASFQFNELISPQRTQPPAPRQTPVGFPP
jgi:hypothetical protein